MFSQVVKGDPAVLELDPVALWQEVNEFKAIHELCKHMQCLEHWGIPHVMFAWLNIFFIR